MKIDIKKRDEAIKNLRANGFICFPHPRRPKEEKQKEHDGRYRAEKTEPNQPIGDDENYGVIAIKGTSTATFDFDNKKYFRPFIESVIEKGYGIEETPNGYRMYVKDVEGNIQTTSLFNTKIQKKAILEVFGHDHAAIGSESIIFDGDGNEVKYIHRGTDKIFSYASMDFHNVIDQLCNKFKLDGKETSKQENYEQRQRFAVDKIPTKGTSNTFYFNAALYCNSKDISKTDAIERIKKKL